MSVMMPMLLIGGGLLLSALGMLALAGARRGASPVPARREPRVVIGEAPEAVAARVCRYLAVADTMLGSRPSATVPECDGRVRRIGIRTALGQRLCWAVARSAGAIELYDDLDAVEAALVRHIRRHRGLEPAGRTRDVRAGGFGAGRQDGAA